MRLFAFSAAVAVWIAFVPRGTGQEKGFGGPGESTIDRIVGAHLRKQALAPAPRCSDPVFIRRVYLDMTGTLPRAAEVKNFLDNPKPDKRSALIERLFTHEAFPDYQAMRWCDRLRVKSEFPSRLWPNAVQAYQRWLTDACRDNVPYDRFARALLTSSGSNFHEAPVNFFRAIPRREAAAFAESAVLTFLGIRPEHLPAAQRDGLAPCFSMIGFKETAEWKEEIVFFDRVRAEAARAAGTLPAAVFPDGKRVVLDANRDPREVFADWLTSPANAGFARCAVNRIWHDLTGRGIIHEPDDLRPDNPPSCPELLDYLAREFVSHRFDQRHIMRLILNSETYQRSCVPPAASRADKTGLSHYLVRRLEAEVLMDAINQVTGTRETYSSEIPEPFTFIPPTHRAASLGDGSITSPFLDMFGRPPRDSGLVSERSNEVSDTQMLHLLNSTHIQDKIEKSPLIKSLQRDREPFPAMVTELYLTLLSRVPSDGDLKAVTELQKRPGRNRKEVVADLFWALLNSREFLYRH